MKRLSLSDAECALLALAQAVEQRDVMAAGHCERLARTAVILGVALRLPRTDLLNLYRGGYLHDIGKVGLPDSILFNPGPLNAEQWAIMRTHPARGEAICRPLRSLAPVLPLIRHHHERWDGGGYPDRLRGEEIPLPARILQIADIYDALTSPRAYKSAFSPDQALQIIVEETEWGWHDPHITDVFVHVHGHVLNELARYREEGEPHLGHVTLPPQKLVASR